MKIKNNLFFFYKNLLKYRPNFSDVHYSLAVLLLKTGRLDAATAHFKEVLRLKPDYAQAYNGLGAVMVSKGKLTEALFLFQQALQIDPYLPEAKDNLKKLSDYYKTR